MLAVVLWLSSSGFAQEKKEEPSAESVENLESIILEPPAIEIIVFGENDVHMKRKELEDVLFKQGYESGIDKGDKIIYRPQTAWKPSVVLHDSGFVAFKRTPPRFESYVNTNSWSDYLYCLPPLTLMCIKASGWMVSNRRLRHVKTDLVEESRNELEAWQKSIVAFSSQIRLQETIPTLLENLWQDGLNENNETSVEQAKETIAEFWKTRACNDIGNEARSIVLEFIEEEIQTTEHAFIQHEYELFLQNPCAAELLESVD